MINKDSISKKVLTLSKNGWNISIEKNILIAESPLFGDPSGIEKCKYKLNLIKQTAICERYIDNELVSSEEVSFDVLSRKKVNDKKVIEVPLLVI